LALIGMLGEILRPMVSPQSDFFGHEGNHPAGFADIIGFGMMLYAGGRNENPGHFLLFRSSGTNPRVVHLRVKRLSQKNGVLSSEYANFRPRPPAWHNAVERMPESGLRIGPGAHLNRGNETGRIRKERSGESLRIHQRNA